MYRWYARCCRLMLIVAALAAGAAAGVIAIRFTVVAVIVVAAVWYQTRRRWGGASTHGTAGFTTIAELERAGMLDAGTGQSLILGRVGDFADPVTKPQALRALLSPITPSELAVQMASAAFFRSRRLSRRFIRAHSYVHVGVVSKTGGGKSVGIVEPVLKSYSGNMFILDFKGELFTKCAATRAKMGHTIIKLSPMGEAAGFNPLPFLDPSALDFLDDCRDLANAIIVRTGNEHDPHFNDAAELVLTAFIAFVVACSAKPEFVHFGTVRMLLSSPESFDEAIAVMRKNANPLIANFGGQCDFFQGEERGSVLTTVQRHTVWMDSAAMVACLRRNDFDPSALKGGKVSVFCVVPPRRLVTWAPWVRMVVGSTLRALCKDEASEKDQTVFMLDEVASLGRFQALENAVNIVRGYGIRLIFILQSFEQLKTCYGDNAGVVLDNLGTIIAFNISSLDTARTLSDRMGDRTICFTTRNSNDGSGTSTGSMSSGESRNRSIGSGTNQNQQGRRLMFPNEILQLRDTALIFHNQMPPILAERLTIFRDPEFRRNRMGRQAGVGLIGGVAATMALAASIAFAVFVTSLPVPRFQSPNGSRYGAWPSGYGSRWQGPGDGMERSGGYNLFPELAPGPGPSIFPELAPLP